MLRRTSLWLWAVAMGLSFPLTGRASEFSGSARASLISGVDTNAARTYENTEGADLLGSLVADGRAQWRGERGGLSGEATVGGRKFLRLADQDTLAWSSGLEGLLWLTPRWSAGAESTGKQRLGGGRDYADLSGGIFTAFLPHSGWEVRLAARGQRFWYWPNFAYSFSGAEVGPSISYAFLPRHLAFASFALGVRRYQSSARPAPEDLRDPSRRQDRVIRGLLGYEYRGPFRLSAEYGYFEQRSNSYGESLFRHRLSVKAGVRLPWDLQLMAQGTLQLARYPDGIYLSPDLLLAQDEETSNSLSVRLVRPLSAQVDLELRYALFANQLTQERLSYLRQVGTLAVSWRL